MYQSKTAKLSMNSRNAFLVLSVVIIVLSTGVNAQESIKLRDLVEEEGFVWLIGEWTVTTEQGQTLQTIYKWELDGHFISLGFQRGEYKGKGMIYYDFNEDAVVQVGLDNKGGLVKGRWEPDGDMAVVKLYYTGPDGQSNKMGIKHANVDADTMKVSFYTLDDYDELGEEPTGTMEYKRLKKRPDKKAEEKKKSGDNLEQKEKKDKKEPVPLTKMKVNIVR